MHKRAPQLLVSLTLALASFIVFGKNSFDANKPNAMVILREKLLADMVKTVRPPKSAKLEDQLPSLLKQSGVRSLRVFLYYSIEDPELQALAIAQMPEAAAVISSPALQQKLKSIGPNQYAPILDKVSKNQSGMFADYQLRITGTSVLIGPKKLLDQVDETKLQSSPIAKLHQKRFVTPQPVEVTVEFPEGLKDVEAKVKEGISKASGEENSMGAGIIGALVGAVLEPFGKLKDLSVSFDNDLQENRKLAFLANLRDAKEGKRIYKQLTTDEADELSFELGAKLRKELQNDTVKSAFEYKDGVIEVRSSWPKSGDAAMKRKFGQIMMKLAFSMPDPVPVDWKQAPVYAEEPMIPEDVSLDEVKVKLPEVLHRNIYPSSWNQSVDIDPLPITFASWPNYTILEVIGVDGKALETTRAKSFFTNKDTSTLRFSLKDRKAVVKTAKIRFDTKLASGVDVFEFTKNDAPGTVKRGKLGACRLEWIKHNAIKVTPIGSSQVVLHPYDTSGRYLAPVPPPQTEGFRRITKEKGSYQGNIAGVKVVMSGTPIEHSWTMTLDMDQIRKRAMPKEPTTQVPTRMDSRKLRQYRTLSKEEFDQLKVTWDAKNKNLQVFRNDEGEFRDQAVWQAWIWSDEGPQVFAGNAWGRSRSWDYKYNKMPARGDQIIGMCKLTIPEKVTTIEFVKQADGQEMVKTLADGFQLVVQFDQNQVSTEYRKDGRKTFSSARPYYIAAYDNAGKRLYAESAFFGQKLSYWGQPSKLVMLMPEGKQSRTIPFTVDLNRTSKEKAETYAKKHAHMHRLISTAMHVNHVIHRNSFAYKYGDDLAHVFYLNDNKRPEFQIPERLAQSDPKGAERFGYKAKPYRGYTFTVTEGIVDDKGKKTPYPRASKAVTFKWDKGVFTSKPISGFNRPAVLMKPTKKGWPYILVDGSKVLFKRTNEDITFAPRSHWPKDWQRLSYMQQLKDMWQVYKK